MQQTQECKYTEMQTDIRLQTDTGIQTAAEMYMDTELLTAAEI